MDLVLTRTAYMKIWSLRVMPSSCVPLRAGARRSLLIRGARGCPRHVGVAVAGSAAVAVAVAVSVAVAVGVAAAVDDAGCGMMLDAG